MFLLFVHEELIFHLILMGFFSNEFIGKIPFWKIHIIFDIKGTNFNAVFFKMIILMGYWWVIKKKQFCFKNGLKRSQILKFCIFGRFIEFLSLIQFWYSFFFRDRFPLISYCFGDKQQKQNSRIWTFLFYIQI